MCGRFVLHHGISELQNDIEFATDQININPDYNVAPTKPIIAIIRCPHTLINKSEICHWGLVPSWAKDTTWSAKLINARAETIKEKPSFRNAYKRRRCLIPASGYYEWKIEKKTKQPYYIHMYRNRPMFFAGLWEIWNNPDGSELYSCTIATVGASPQLKTLHSRMPVILQGAARTKWIEADESEIYSLSEYLVPYMGEDIEFHQVSKAVNNARWNNPRAVDPITN